MRTFLSSIFSYVKSLFCTLTLTLTVALPDRLILWRLPFLTAASSCCVNVLRLCIPAVAMSKCLLLAPALVVEKNY